MGFSTIVGAIAFMIIFAGMTVFAVTVQKNITLQASEQTAASERERSQNNAAISVTSASYAEDATIDWTDTTYSDFTAGSLVSTIVASPGTLVLVGPAYTSNGTWTSPVIDTGAAGTNYTTISWTAVLPSGAALNFQARGGASTAAILASAFTGSDGTSATAYAASGANLNDSVHDGRRYIQYRANLTTTNTANTPQLQEISIGVTRDGGVSTISLENTGSEKLDFTETDLYLAGERVPRNTSSRTLDFSGASDQILWLPGESITYNVFRTVTTPATITVAQGAARAAGTVN